MHVIICGSSGYIPSDSDYAWLSTLNLDFVRHKRSAYLGRLIGEYCERVGIPHKVYRKEYAIADMMTDALIQDRTNGASIGLIMFPGGKGTGKLVMLAVQKRVPVITR